MTEKKSQQICSRCLKPQKIFHETRIDMCEQCGNNYLLVESLRDELEFFNPPRSEPFKEFILNGRRRVKCPHCHRKAFIFGVTHDLILCNFCKFGFYRFKSEYVVVGEKWLKKYIDYRGTSHLPFYDFSTKMENALEQKLNLLGV
jgi:ribosomal protein S27E